MESESFQLAHTIERLGSEVRVAKTVNTLQILSIHSIFEI